MLRKDLNELDCVGEIGDWCFYNNDADMFLVYPFTDERVPGISKDIVHLYLRTPEQPNEKTPCWNWDGNRETPTLSPSINVIGRWHGWLEAGKLKTA